MGKAMAVQSAKTGRTGLSGVWGNMRAYGGKAKLHTTRAHRAIVDVEPLRNVDSGRNLIELSTMIDF